MTVTLSWLMLDVLAVRAADVPSRLLGTASCAAAGCHGGIKQANGIGAEYSVWLQNDPHARAYSVLLNDDSRHMAQLLKLPKPAHESAVCLNCHSPTTAAALVGPRDADAVATNIGRLVPHRELPPFDGVGCEQCHGPSEKWVEAHVRPDWKTRSSDSKRSLGFRETKDSLVRSRTCVECHVGAAGRDVNHDLIAAGHPRLFFEMSAFHNNMPKHWQERPKAGDPRAERRELRADERDQFESNLWAIGQLATAEASLRLLEQRAALAETTSAAAWPELAEWNCFACHHDLRDASWRQVRTDAAKSVSKPLWNAWPLALIDLLPFESDSEYAAASRKSVTELRALMNRPDPPRQVVRELVGSAARSLAEWAESVKEADGPGKLRDANPERTHVWRLQQLSGDAAAQRASENWDSAAQVYLGLSALLPAPRTNGAAPDRVNRLRVVLDSLGDSLNFPDGYQSPKQFDDRSIQRLRSDLKRFHELLEVP